MDAGDARDDRGGDIMCRPLNDSGSPAQNGDHGAADTFAPLPVADVRGCGKVSRGGLHSAAAADAAREAVPSVPLPVPVPPEPPRSK